MCKHFYCLLHCVTTLHLCLYACFRFVYLCVLSLRLVTLKEETFSENCRMFL